MKKQLARKIQSAPARSSSLAFCFWTFVFLASPALHSSAQQRQEPTSAADATLKAAICPIVYPSDETPGNKGYRYTFFGNAFFVNSQGYLVTAAHVLQTFRDSGQPYVLLDRPNAPPQTLKANIIAVDWTHDVAVLRAVPNPFEGKYRIAFLPLAAKRVVAGNSVVATALHPVNIRNASTYQMPVQDWSSAQVLDFVQTREEPRLPETDLFLFSHEVQKGQSGSPVLSAGSHTVVGLVDGRWLRPSGIATAQKNSTQYTGPMGAAVPIDYVIQLLQKNSVTWTTAPGENAAAQTVTEWSNVSR
ncbi:MAG TPA: serine protease [Candidatus Dormibacteraeota bacterium]|nr:serine protease [Candidatus Dormibacteraeota bacterium]